MSNVIDSVSYDQYKNIPTADEMGIKTKIIFSQEAYLKLLTLIKKTKDLGSETGCLFVGGNNMIYLKRPSINVVIILSH